MSIFIEVKEHVTAREAAEFYGLKVLKKGIACCPFHNDRHPSMKIDRFYYCFACGAKGDAINYVADRFVLSQHEAARKIVNDFHLILKSDREQIGITKESALAKARAAEQERKQMIHIQNQFKEWCNKTVANLKVCVQIIESAKQFFLSKPSDESFESEDFVFLMHKAPLIDY